MWPRMIVPGGFMSREIKARSLTSGLRCSALLWYVCRKLVSNVLTECLVMTVHLLSLNPVAWRILFSSAPSVTVELPDKERRLLFFRLFYSALCECGDTWDSHCPRLSVALLYFINWDLITCFWNNCQKNSVTLQFLFEDFGALRTQTEGPEV